MCRSCADGGRRCATSAAPRSAAHNNMRRARRTVERLSGSHIHAVLGRDTTTTYWAGPVDAARWATSKMAPIRDPDGGFWKPDGGAWTAPAQHISESGAVASSWTSWCEREGDRDLPDRLIPVNAADHAVVLRIATERDVDACRVHWPTLDPMGELHFSFEQMRLDGIDAIEYHENEETHWSALRGWDVDCTLWLNPEKAIAEKAVSRSREV